MFKAKYRYDISIKLLAIRLRLDFLCTTTARYNWRSVTAIES